MADWKRKIHLLQQLLFLSNVLHILACKTVRISHFSKFTAVKSEKLQSRAEATRCNLHVLAMRPYDRPHFENFTTLTFTLFGPLTIKRDGNEGGGGLNCGTSEFPMSFPHFSFPRCVFAFPGKWDALKRIRVIGHAEFILTQIQMFKEEIYLAVLA